MWTSASYNQLERDILPKYADVISSFALASDYVTPEITFQNSNVATKDSLVRNQNYRISWRPLLVFICIMALIVMATVFLAIMLLLPRNSKTILIRFCFWFKTLIFRCWLFPVSILFPNTASSLIASNRRARTDVPKKIQWRFLKIPPILLV